MLSFDDLCCFIEFHKVPLLKEGYLAVELAFKTLRSREDRFYVSARKPGSEEIHLVPVKRRCVSHRDLTGTVESTSLTNQFVHPLIDG